MKRRTCTFEFTDPDRSEVFRKSACDGFDHRIFAQRVIYSDGSNIPPRVLIMLTDSILHDMSIMKVLATRAHEYGGKLVAINGKPVHEDGTPWEWKLFGNEVIFIFLPPKEGRLCLPSFLFFMLLIFFEFSIFIIKLLITFLLRIS